MTQQQTAQPVPDGRRELVVVGGGMVARRLVDALRARDESGQWAITLLCEEPRAPYDRVALTSYFTGRDPEDLALGARRSGTTRWSRSARRRRHGHRPRRQDRDHLRRQDARLRLPRPGHRVVCRGAPCRARTFGVPSSIARSTTWPTCARTSRRCAASSAARCAERWSVAACSASRRPGPCARSRSTPPWSSSPRGSCRSRWTRAAARPCGVSSSPSVSRFAPGRPPPRSAGPARWRGCPSPRAGSRRRRGGVRRGRPATGRARPRGRPRGGRARRRRRRRRLPDSRSDVWAIGEVACIEGRCLGLVALGYTMAEIVADRLLGGEGPSPAPTSRPSSSSWGRRRQLRRRLRPGAGRARGRHLRPGCGRLQEARHVRRREDAPRRHPRRRRQRLRRTAADGGPGTRRRPRGIPAPGGAAPAPAGDLPDDAAVCSCNNVSAGAIRCSITDGGCTDLAGVKACTKAGRAVAPACRS